MNHISFHNASAARQKVLILDIDGVALKAPRALGLVSQHVCDYVQKELSIPDRRTAKRVNQLLYTQFGHTLNGMRAVFNSPRPTEHFNDQVYTAPVFEALADSVSDPDFRQRAVEVWALIAHANKHNVPIFLFSNAPWFWCLSVYHMLRLEEHKVPEEHVLFSEHPVFARRLKPDPTVYDHLEMFLAHQYHDDDLDLLFVDDSFANLVPTLQRHNWRNFHLLSGTKAPLLKAPTVRTIRNITEVARFLS